MTKKIFWTVSIALAFTLSACGGVTAKKAGPVKTEDPTKKTEKPITKPTEVVSLKVMAEVDLDVDELTFVKDESSFQVTKNGSPIAVADVLVDDSADNKAKAVVFEVAQGSKDLEQVVMTASQSGTKLAQSKTISGDFEPEKAFMVSMHSDSTIKADYRLAKGFYVQAPYWLSRGAKDKVDSKDAPDEILIEVTLARKSMKLAAPRGYMWLPSTPASNDAHVPTIKECYAQLIVKDQPIKLPVNLQTKGITATGIDPTKLPDVSDKVGYMVCEGVLTLPDKVTKEKTIKYEVSLTVRTPVEFTIVEEQP